MPDPTGGNGSPLRGGPPRPVDVEAEKAAVAAGIQKIEMDAKLVAGLTPAQRDLFEYYKYRIDTFEKEREETMKRVQDLEGTRQDYYKLKWELTKKDEQIEDLQKALSDAHVFLYEEREQVLKLAAENDELRIQELEDRKRIQHLLALTQPISQEVTYFRDCRPGKISRTYTSIDKPTLTGTQGSSSSSSSSSSTTNKLMAAPKGSADVALIHSRGMGGRQDGENVPPSGSSYSSGSSSSSSSGSSTSRLRPQSATAAALANAPIGETHTRQGSGSDASYRPPVRVLKSAGGSKGGGQVVRTIYMPNESVDVLKLIIQSLRTQLDEQNAFNEQRCQALMEDRLIRESEHAERRDQSRKTIADLQQEIRGLMEVHTATTRDYLNLRQAEQVKEKALREECARLSAEMKQCNLQMQRMEEEKRMREAKRQQESEAFVNLFRKQALGSEEDLAIIKGQYEAAHELYEKQIKYLEAKLANAVNKYKASEERRRLEMQGYAADVKSTRARLRDLEKILGGLRIVNPDGETSADPKILRFLAFHKDFTDMKHHLADIQARLDKGVV